MNTHNAWKKCMKKNLSSNIIDIFTELIQQPYRMSLESACCLCVEKLRRSSWSASYQGRLVFLLLTACRSVLEQDIETPNCSRLSRSWPCMAASPPSVREWMYACVCAQANVRALNKSSPFAIIAGTPFCWWSWLWVMTISIKYQTS